jgi:hypothetical protein
MMYNLFKGVNINTPIEVENIKFNINIFSTKKTPKIIVYTIL